VTALSPYARRGGVVRLAYLAIAIVCWVVTGFGRFSGGRAIVLCYHGVPDEQRARFRWQLRRMAKRMIATADLPVSRRFRLGAPRVAATFDDAFANLLPNVLEATAERGAPVTIYAVSECLGRTPDWDMPTGHPEASMRTMTPEELREASARTGVTIGSHTMRHPRLSEVEAARLEEELAGSKRSLEDLLDREVGDLALPHGAWNEPVLAAALGAGYDRVMTLEPVLEPAGLPEGAIGRFLMSPDAWRLEFLLTIDGAYRWLPLVRRLGRRATGRTSAIAAQTAEAHAAG
jgi:peptidoglycan/xylan/chitin deacetylase (PgdA/CDA1 family)